MPRFPYMNFPFPFYKGQPRNASNFYSFSNGYLRNSFRNNCETTAPLANNSHINNSNISSIQSRNSNVEEEKENFRNYDKKNKSNKNNEDCLFDLFGLKIYSDDVLLVSLIYFLYSEEVKDDSLFIVLILLLLS